MGGCLRSHGMRTLNQLKAAAAAEREPNECWSKWQTNRADLPFMEQLMICDWTVGLWLLPAVNVVMLHVIDARPPKEHGERLLSPTPHPPLPQHSCTYAFTHVHPDARTWVMLLVNVTVTDSTIKGWFQVCLNFKKCGQHFTVQVPNFHSNWVIIKETQKKKKIKLPPNFMTIRGKLARDFFEIMSKLNCEKNHNW